MDNTMRYLHFSYNYVSKTISGNGDMSCECRVFPSAEKIKKLARQNVRDNKTVPLRLEIRIVFLGMFEFKSKEDYEAWVKK